MVLGSTLLFTLTEKKLNLINVVYVSVDCTALSLIILLLSLQAYCCFASLSKREFFDRVREVKAAQ